jgi:hypothetical protein
MLAQTAREEGEGVEKKKTSMRWIQVKSSPAGTTT